jgi:hypothetical protein
MLLVMSAMIVNAQVTPSDRTSPSSADTSSYSRSSSSGVSVSVSDLPQAIRDNISKDYPGFTIKDASSVSGKSGLNYQVNVTKGTENETLLYDNSGKFLKKWSGKSHDMKGKDSKDDMKNK